MKPFSSEAVSNEYLHVNSCDCQYLHGYDGSCTRLQGRIDYHILYIFEGCCFVTDNHSELPAPAGSVILYRPGEPQQYKFYAHTKSTSYYIHFSGVGCSALLDKLGMSTGRIFHIGTSQKLETTFISMIEEFHLQRPFYYEYCHAYLMRILSIIGRKIYNAESTVESNINSKIIDVCKVMHKEYAENKSIAYYASLYGVSESRFTHLFKEYAKISPIKYLLNIKIQRAKDLMGNTDLSISQISEYIGIPDQNYFSRLFKQHVGLSPIKYRDSL